MINHGKPSTPKPSFPTYKQVWVPRISFHFWIKLLQRVNLELHQWCNACLCVSLCLPCLCGRASSHLCHSCLSGSCSPSPLLPFPSTCRWHHLPRLHERLRLSWRPRQSSWRLPRRATPLSAIGSPRPAALIEAGTEATERFLMAILNPLTGTR